MTNKTFYEKLSEKLVEDIKSIDSSFLIIDKIDKVNISAHYAQTHLSVAILIMGILKNDHEKIQLSEKLVKSYLEMYDSIHLSQNFHHDFNNFAISLYYLIYKETDIKDEKLLECLEENINVSKDSKHYTINWLPMRIFNLITKNSLKFSKLRKIKIKGLILILKKAINKDFVFEDRLPKGKSFNLQYNISTIAGLCIIQEYYDVNINLDKFIKRSIEFIDPEGDINYMGRGTNQIFAWGPWFYLIKKNKIENIFEINKTHKYFTMMYDNNINDGNILMNNYKAKEKDFWWDYHYSSVYQSHLLMWIMLSKYKVKDKEKNSTITNIPLEIRNNTSSGIEIYREDDFFAFIFNGSEEYFAENGPTLYNLWVSGIGTLFKGGFGPLPDRFGMKSTNTLDSIFNYLGPLSITYNNNVVNFEYCTKAIEVRKEDGYIKIIYEVDRSKKTFFNTSFFEDINFSWNLLADNVLIGKFNHFKVKNQYKKVNISQTESIHTQKWCLIIKINKEDKNEDF